MFLEKEQKEDILFIIAELNQQIFEISLLSYLLFYLLDDLFNSLISNYFNLNILLIVVIISGILLNIPALSPQKKEKKVKPIGIKDYLFIFLLGIIAGGIIFYKISLDSWLRLTISIISGFIIILISILLLNENNQENI